MVFKIGEEDYRKHTYFMPTNLLFNTMHGPLNLISYVSWTAAIHAFLCIIICVDL